MIDSVFSWNIMILFEILEKYVNNKTEYKVKFMGELSSAFEVKSGLQQRDALSPALFNLRLDKMIRELNYNNMLRWYIRK